MKQVIRTNLANQRPAIGTNSVGLQLITKYPTVTAGG